MNTATLRISLVRWPTLPFFKPGASPSKTGSRGCTIELTDGRILAGDLVRFEPGAQSIDVRLPDIAALHTEQIERIRCIKLTQSLTLVPDNAMLDAVGSTAHHVGHEKLFIVLMHDGSKITGTTRGFVKEKSGLFLFLVEGNSPLATSCFIPAQQFDNFQIGPLLGESLIAKDLVTRETLSTALNTQIEMRGERVGSYLARHAIITVEDLTHALAEQHRRPNIRLGDVLIESGLITAIQLQGALAIQAAHRERRLGDILVDMGAVSLRQIQMALSENLGIPCVDVRQFKIDASTLELIDPAFAIRHRVLPILQMDDSLVVAVENPLAIDFAQDLRFTTGLTVIPVIADSKDLNARLAKHYAGMGNRRAEDGDAAPEFGTMPTTEDLRPHDQTNVEDLASQLNRENPLPVAPGKVRESDARVSDNTLVRLINKIIVEAHSQGASDIHIESNAGMIATRIRFRKDGELEDYLELPPAYRSALVSRIKIMADLDISERRRPQDGKINFGRFGPLPIELRVAVVPTANSLEDIVLRILGGMQPLPLEALEFSARDLAELTKMIARSYGLILVCGPTGSGKTTTLHSVLHHINQPDIKIWTAEDPIEITQPGLRQVQMQPKIGWTFAAAMRAFLRADPDVIMVGEMRDAETTKIGIEASLTGHLVFSTLHTNSAAESIVRLLDLGMDPFNFADSLIGILSQRLARTLCSHCKRPRLASEKEIADLLQEYCNETQMEPAAVRREWQAKFGGGGALKLYEAVGCNECHNGYKGRVGVYELLVSTPKIKDLMRSHAPVPALVKAATEAGMRLLKNDAIDKVWRGMLDLPCARTAST